MDGPRKLAILFLLFGISFIVDAQLNYKEGTIITLYNDTIQGLIYDGGGIRNSKYCQFKENKEATEVKYYPDQIKSYRFVGDKYYVSRKISNDWYSKDCFLEVLLEGNINLYYYFSNTFPLYYMEREGGALTGLPNNETSNSNIQYDYPSNWKAYKLGTSRYKDTLYSFFQDCVDILNQLDVVEYNHKSLMSTTKDYINLTCNNKDCISYERDLRISKPTFGVFTGVQLSKIYFYNLPIESEITSSIPMGVFYNIPLNPFSESLSFQIELLATRLNYKQKFINQTDDYENLKISSTTFAVPLMIQYEFPINKFAPSIGAGKEFSFVTNSSATFKTQRYDSTGYLNYGEVNYQLQKYQKGGWFIDLGFDYELNKNVSLYSSLRVQRYQNLIISDEHFNYITFSSAEKSLTSTKYLTYSSSLRIGLKF